MLEKLYALFAARKRPAGDEAAAQASGPSAFATPPFTSVPGIRPSYREVTRRTDVARARKRASGWRSRWRRTQARRQGMDRRPSHLGRGFLRAPVGSFPESVALVLRFDA